MTAAQTTVEGVDGPRVTAWFEANVDGVHPPLDFKLIAGGHSNLTFSVTDDDGHVWVLRRPPLGHLLATAHDMGREHTIISALGPTPVPVAPAIGLCSDENVNGAPFYVMGFVEGTVVRDAETARTVLDVDDRRRAGESIADVMAEIHAVDVDAVGLGKLGKKEGYIARQLKRWYSQFQQSNELTQRPVPLVHEVHDTLAARIPQQEGASVVHGDYRLDNMIYAPDKPQVQAVLDWELSTLGHPLADLAFNCLLWHSSPAMYYGIEGLDHAALGIPSRDDYVARYCARTGRGAGITNFHLAFACFRFAVIFEGIAKRAEIGTAAGADAATVGRLSVDYARRGWALARA
jgi:aminoglycoside phosphotransferase (APT) family kinase protein